MTDSVPVASLWRRLGSMVYDGFLVIALLMLASLPVTYYFHASIQSPGLPRIAFQLYLLSIWAAYFIAFWHYQHQTPGMKVWRLTLQTPQKCLSLPMLFKRWVFAWLQLVILPILPLLWNHSAYHDRWSQTYVMFHPKERS